MWVCFAESLVFGSEDVDIGAGAAGWVREEFDVGGWEKV